MQQRLVMLLQIFVNSKMVVSLILFLNYHTLRILKFLNDIK